MLLTKSNVLLEGMEFRFILFLLRGFYDEQKKSRKRVVKEA